MTDAAPVAGRTPLNELAFELKLAIGRDVQFNQDFEVYIARCAADVDTTSLETTLDYCRASTAKLSELYAFVTAAAAIEAEVRALIAGAGNDLERGPSAAAWREKR